MTKYQLIALFFPVATGVGAIATAWLAKRIWIDRRYEREKAAEVTLTEPALDLEAAFQEAHSAIETVHRRIHKALTP